MSKRLIFFSNNCRYDFLCVPSSSCIVKALTHLWEETSLLGGPACHGDIGVTQGTDLSFVNLGDEELQNLIESFEV